MDTVTVLQFVGGLAFGGVIGWVTYFIMRRAQPKVLNDLATIIGILGGATIVGLFDPKGPVFAGYAIGLAAGFFGYYWVFLKIVRKHAIREVIIKQLRESGGAPMGGDSNNVASGDEGRIDWGPEARVTRKKK